MKYGHWKSMLLSGAAVICCAPSAHAGWVTVTESPNPVLTNCNPKPFTTPTPAACLLTGNTLLAALGTGYILKASTSYNIVANGVNVGTLYDRVYCIGSVTTCTTSGANANTYVLATRAHLNANAWNGHSSESFEINDTIRRIKNGISTDSGYWMGPPSGGSTTSTNPDLGIANQKWVEYTGKTQYGLNDTLVATRDNDYLDHRQDANASDPDGVSSEWTAWLVLKQVCSGGVNTALPAPTFSIKLWEGGEESQDHYTQWMSGWRCS